MGKLILFELRKILKNKALWICLAVAAVILGGNAVITFIADKSIGDEEYATTMLDFSKNFMSKGMLVIILGVLITILVCEDASHSTLKNIIAKGYSRRQVFFSKYIATLIVTIGFILVLMLYTIGLSAALFQKTAVTTNDILSYVFIFIAVAAHHAVFFAITEAFEKTGAAIAINIMLPMVTSVAVLGIDSISKLKNLMFSDLTLSAALSTFASFNGVNGDFGRALAVCVVIGVGFMVGGFFLNNRKEI